MEAKQNVICPFCGKDITPDSHYCLFCGKDLSDQGELKQADTFLDPEVTLGICFECGAIILPYSRFCSECGTYLLKRPKPRLTDVGPLPSLDNVIPLPIEKIVTPDDEDDSLRLQQRMLEVIYVHRHGFTVGSEGADRLFPFGWFDVHGIKHIKALAEAIDKGILLRETDTWNVEMIEGAR